MLVAHFGASFENFNSALSQAKVHLTTFDKGVMTASRDLSRLNEGFSGAKIVAEAQRVATAVHNVGGASKLTANEQTNVNRVVTEAIAKYRALGEQAPKHLMDLANQTKQLSTATSGWGGFVKTAVGTMTGFIGAQAIMRGVGSAFSFAKDAAIGMNADLEKSTIQFGTLMGDTKRAEAHVRSLFEFAKKTPFETGPVIEASRKMQTFGGDALNTMANLKLLGDASAATGAPIEDLGSWVGRMYAALKGGQPFGEASMRLMELGVMTPQTRVQMEGLAKSAGGGEKAFKLFQDSLTGFSGAMVAQSNTWDGLMSSITDAINLTLADALLPFFESVKFGAKIILDAMGSQGVQKAFTSLKETMSGVFGGDGRKMITGFIDALLAGASGALSALGMIHRVGSGLDLVFATVASAVIRAVESMVGAFATMLSAAAKVPGTGKAFDDAAEALHRMKGALTSTRQGYEDQAKSALNAVKGNSDFSKSLEAGKTTIAAVRQSLKDAAAAHVDVADATKRNNTEADKNVVLTKEQEAAIKKAAETLKKFNEDVREFGRLNLSVHEALEKGAFGKIVTDLGPAPELISRTTVNMNTLGGSILQAGQNTLGWKDFGVLLDGLPPKIQSVAQTIGGNLTDVLKNIPGLLQQAFTGGGGLLGALKAIGVQLAEALAAPILAKLSKLQQSAVGAGSSLAAALGGSAGGGTIGTIASIAGGLGGAALAASSWGTAMAASGAMGTVALGAATLGIGAAAVGVALLIKKFAMVPAEVKKVRKEVDEFQQALWNTLTPAQAMEAQGRPWAASMIGVRDAVMSIGGSAEYAAELTARLLNTDNPKAARDAMAEINDILKEQQRILDLNITSANTLFDEIMGAGSSGFAEWMRPILEQFISLGLLTDEQVGKLRGLGEEGEFNFKKMEDASALFKGRIESLGPAFQQTRLDVTSKKYIEAFDAMIKGGADMGGALFDAKEEFGALVGDAIRHGRTLPANMQPWIEELHRTGQLIDADGRKLTDLSGLKWGEPLKTEAEIAKEGWNSILIKIQELIDKVTGPLITAVGGAMEKAGDDTRRFADGVREAINRIPRRIPIDVDGRYNAPNIPTGGGGEGFASGTMGRMGKWFQQFGSGTPTILHGEEAVVRKDQATEFAMSVLRELFGRNVGFAGGTLGGGDAAALLASIESVNQQRNALLGRPLSADEGRRADALDRQWDALKKQLAIVEQMNRVDTERARLLGRQLMPQEQALANKLDYQWDTLKKQLAVVEQMNRVDTERSRLLGRQLTQQEQALANKLDYQWDSLKKAREAGEGLLDLLVAQQTTITNSMTSLSGVLSQMNFDPGQTVSTTRTITLQAAVDQINQLFQRYGFSNATQHQLNQLAGAFGWTGAQTVNAELVTKFLAGLERIYVMGGSSAGQNVPNYPGYASGTMGRHGSLFHDFAPRGELVTAHGEEAIIPKAQWPGIAASLGQSSGPVNVYVAVDPKTGGVRVLSDYERRQVQTWINTGELTVPQRMVTGR